MSDQLRATDGPPRHSDIYSRLAVFPFRAGTPQNPDVFYTLTRGSRGERNYRQGVVRYRVADAVWSICRPTYPTPPMILQTLGTTISVASGSDDTREKMKEWLRGLRPDQVANLVENGVEFEYSTTLYTAGGIAYQARLVCNSEVGEIARGRHSRRSRMLRYVLAGLFPKRKSYGVMVTHKYSLKPECTLGGASRIAVDGLRRRSSWSCLSSKAPLCTSVRTRVGPSSTGTLRLC